MRKRKVYLIAAGVLVLLTCLIFLGPSEPSPLVKRLPDGSYLRIVSLQYGTNHQYTVPPLNAFKKLLAENVPVSWTARLGLRNVGGSVSYSGRPGETTLGVVTICDMTEEWSFVSPHVELYDEQDRAFGSGVAISAASGKFRGKRRFVALWPILQFPEDAKRVVLRFTFSEGSGTNSKARIVEFNLPNPSRNNAK